MFPILFNFVMLLKLRNKIYRFLFSNKYINSKNIREENEEKKSTTGNNLIERDRNDDGRSRESTFGLS
jgi:hypothetical protein